MGGVYPESPLRSPKVVGRGSGSLLSTGFLPARHSMRRPNTWLGQPLPRLGGCPTLRRPERGGTANGSHRRESPVGQQPLMRNDFYPVAAALNRSQKRDSVSPPEPTEVGKFELSRLVNRRPAVRAEAQRNGGDTHLFRTRAIQVRDRSKRPLATATRPAAVCRSSRNYRRARSGPGSPRGARPNGLNQAAQARTTAGLLLPGMSAKAFPRAP